MTIEIPGLNVKMGLELCDDDMDMYVHSLRLYISNMPSALANMRNVSEKTLHDYSISAHGVKSISEYVGAEEVIKTAKQLEAMSKDGNLAAVLAENDAFIKYAENLVNNIRTWLEKNNLTKR
jgi:HPt (histidine-containing phosphotransfer) domain-containing protein